MTASFLLSGAPYPARGVVEYPMVGVFLSRTVLRELVDSSDRFRDFVFTILNNRIDHLMEVVCEVAFHKLDLRSHPAS